MGEGLSAAGGDPEPTRAELVDRDVRALLEVDVSYGGWEHGTADMKAFYVRGFTWFKDCVIKDKLQLTDCTGFIPHMKERLRSKEAWLSTPFPWDSPFGGRQFIDAASVKLQLTPKFHKAAEIILLCEVIADHFHARDASRPSPTSVYDHMRIEPAVSFIHGFRKDVVDGLSAEERLRLRQWTGQPSNDVFYDMADGKTVTHKLAERTLKFFGANVRRIDLGDADHRFSASRTYNPSKHERVDVKNDDLPEEARR